MADGWRVTGQRGTEEPINGKFQAVMEVNVVTDDGTTNTFRIPTTRYGAEAVKAMVDEWFERHQAVANL